MNNQTRQYSNINTAELNRLLHSDLPEKAINMLVKSITLADKFNLIEITSDNKMAKLFRLPVSTFKRCRKQLIDVDFMRTIELRGHTQSQPRRALMIPVSLRWSYKSSDKTYWTKVWNHKKEPYTRKEYCCMDFGAMYLRDVPPLDPAQEIVRDGNIVFYKESGEVAMTIPAGYSNIDEVIAKVFSNHYSDRCNEKQKVVAMMTEDDLQTNIDKAPDVNPYVTTLISHQMDRAEYLGNISIVEAA